MAAVQRVSGDITCDTNWCDCVDLDGQVRVRSNACLTIFPGTQVIARRIPTRPSFPNNPFSVLIIAKGSKIRSLGTCTDPVIFTTDVGPGTYPDGTIPDETESVAFRKRGMWGGIAILGCAPITLGPSPFGTTDNQAIVATQSILASGLITAANSPWLVAGGGLNNNGNVILRENDDSGILRYTRVEFAGLHADLSVVPDPMNPVVTPYLVRGVNGITLVACGNQTVLDHVQVSFSGDNSLGIFGGSPNVRSFFSTAAAADDVKTDFGCLSCINTVVSWRVPDQDGPDWENISIDLGTPSPLIPSPDGTVIGWTERWPVSNFESNSLELSNTSLTTSAFDGTGAITGVPSEGAFPPSNPNLPNGAPNPLLNRPTETYVTNATLIGLSCRTRTITNPPSEVRAVGAGICLEDRSCSQVTNAIVAGWTVGLHVLEAMGVMGGVNVQLAMNPIKVQQEIFNTLLAANSYNIGYITSPDAAIAPTLEIPGAEVIAPWFCSPAVRYKKNEKPNGNCGIDQRKLTLRCPWEYDCPDIRFIQDKPACRGAVLDSHNLLEENWVKCDPRSVQYCWEDPIPPPAPTLNP